VYCMYDKSGTLCSELPYPWLDYLVERMGGRGRVNPHLRTPFYADSNELVFVLIALTLTEILVDCDLT